MVKQPMSPGYCECSRSSRSPLLPDVSFPSAAVWVERPGMILGKWVGGAPSPPLNTAPPPKPFWGAMAGREDPPSWEILFTSMFSWSTKNFFSLFIRRVKQTRRAAETPRGSSLPLRSSCSAATSPISARSSGTPARVASPSHPWWLPLRGSPATTPPPIPR